MLVSEPEIEERFGRLIVKEYIGKDKNKVPIYKCLCESVASYRSAAAGTRYSISK